MIINWSSYYNLNFVSLRFFNVYGRGQELQEHMAQFLVFLAQKLAKKHYVWVMKQTRTLHMF